VLATIYEGWQYIGIDKREKSGELTESEASAERNDFWVSNVGKIIGGIIGGLIGSIVGPIGTAVGGGLGAAGGALLAPILQQIFQNLGQPMDNTSNTPKTKPEVQSPDATSQPSVPPISLAPPVGDNTMVSLVSQLNTTMESLKFHLASVAENTGRSANYLSRGDGVWPQSA
jgi:phage tail tape-measure protein